MEFQIALALHNTKFISLHAQLAQVISVNVLRQAHV